jgi:quercetin dioxygenase-like cupin family protein
MSAFQSLSQLDVLSMADGISARSIRGREMTFAVVELAPHSRVGSHQHPHEQMGIVLRGSVVYTVGGESKDMQPGDTYMVHGGIAHEAVAGPQGAVIVDVFSPVREDWTRFAASPPRTPQWP